MELLESLSYLVEHGAAVDPKEKDGNTPLHKAVESGSLELMKYLIEHGADINHENICGQTPLYRAVQCYSLEIVNCLIEHGAKVNYEVIRNSSLKNAVESRSLEIIKYLVGCGAGLSKINPSAGTLLHKVVESGSIDFFVENSATVTREDDWIAILYFACERGRSSMVEYILENVVSKDINNCFDADWSPLRAACYHGHTAVVQTLLKYNIDIRKEKNLECGNEEIVDILNMELKKSIKHRERIQLLKQIEKEKLVKVMFCW